MDKIEELLTRSVDKIYSSKSALEKVLRSGKKLRLYQGFDPTAARLHLGHTIGMRKLMEFANLGHEVIFLFGTGTVLVGDPSQRATGRKLISKKEIENNILTWKDQVKPIVDFSKVKILKNGDWLTKLRLEDIIKIGSKITAVQLFKRENFTRRIEQDDTVWYYETMYPLLQGYDSVVMDVDLEIGGSDQVFNMLIGRELQKKFNNKEKFVLTTKMILGTDGQQMSKTSGNCIWLTDSAKDMFGKLMKVQDQLIPDYFEFFTNISMKEIAKIKNELSKKEVNPINYKKQLAFEITRQFHTEKESREAEQEFESVYQQGKIPSKISTFPQGKLSENPMALPDLLVELRMALSKSEAKRFIEQGGVRINDTVVIKKTKIKISPGDIINVGKRKWVRVK